MTDRKATSIRLSAEADRLLDELNEQLGFKSRTAVLELAVRELAKEWLAEPQRIGYNAQGEAKLMDQAVLDRNHDTAIRIAHERGELPE